MIENKIYNKMKQRKKILSAGFTPGLNASHGQRYTVTATEGIAEHERQVLENKGALNQLKKVIAVQNGRGEPRNLEERLVGVKNSNDSNYNY